MVVFSLNKMAKSKQPLLTELPILWILGGEQRKDYQLEFSLLIG